MNTNFIILNLQQGTPEWREWRHGGIGASEASIIMGQNPFKSVTELLREKRSPVQNQAPNAAMALGTALEPTARERYIVRIGRPVRPVCVQSRQFPFMRASLDGYCPLTPSAVEIKCGRSVYWATATGRAVPRLYFGQTQQILAIMNLQEMDFYCHWPNSPDVLIKVRRDDAYVDQLLQKCLEFWTAVQKP